jgi:hypothetical protein
MEDGGIFYGHLAYFTTICYIFPRFGVFHQEKYGNQGFQHISTLQILLLQCLNVS